MKKFIVFLIMLFVSAFVANAQIVPVYGEYGSLMNYEFHLGEYVFKSNYVDGSLLHRKFKVDVDTDEERRELWNFIRKNEDAIEEKYDIEIERCMFFGSFVEIELSSKDALDAHKKALEEEARKKEAEANKRLKSLNDIL